MSGNEIDNPELAKWDRAFTKLMANTVWPIMKVWFRAEVRGLELFPPAGGALVVSNHSGGMLTPDGFVFVPAFYDRFGYDRPLYTLGHYGIFLVPWGGLLPRLGVVHASRETAAKALRSGGVLLDFPGGDYDAYRPTLRQNVIDFNGRIGYVTTAIEAGVPIVPAVSIGGQEAALFLTRGTWLAKRFGLHRIRMDIFPFTFGFPFGLAPVLPPNIPLPSKFIYQVLEPINIVAQFGTNPDVHAVDAHVRSVMQTALDRLADQRRFPIIG